MSKRFFKKALLSQNVFRDRNGAKINWEKLGGNTGVIALEVETQAQLIEDLNKTAVARKLGVAEVTEAQYEELKKNRRLRKFAQKLSAFGGPVRVLNRDLKLAKAAPSAVADAVPQNQLPPEPVNSAQKTADTELANAVVPPKPRKVGRPRKAQTTTQVQKSATLMIGAPAPA